MFDRRTALAGLGIGVAAPAFAQGLAATTPAASPAPGRDDPAEWIELWPGLPPGAPATLPE